MTHLLSTAAESSTVITIDPLMSDEQARDIYDAVLANGPYGLYAAEKSTGPLESRVAERYDAARNYIAQGGYLGVEEPATALIRRTSYFRSTLMHGERVVAPGFEALNQLPALYDAARSVHGQPHIAPAILYLNLLVPGQELGIHIDVPEFTGADRSITPQWLLVVMRASGLFEDLRVPITTGITYFGDAPGGALRYFPDGPTGQATRFGAPHNSAAVLDTDSLYHGVERVGSSESAAPLGIENGASLHHDGTQWVMTNQAGDSVAEYATDEVRISISWKAYCFADETAQREFEDARASLTINEIERRFHTDLRERSLIEKDATPHLPDIVDLLIDTYQCFPDLAATAPA